VSPVKYELSFYIPEDDILHSHRRENLKCHINAVHVIRSLNCANLSRSTVSRVVHSASNLRE
jgi:hypothetical protein